METSAICRIRDLYRAIAALEAHYEQTYGLNMNQAMLLCTLHQSPGLTSTQLSERLSLTCSNCSKVLAVVERAGLVDSEASKTDRRVKYFTLTPQGEQRLAALKADAMPLPDLQNFA